MNLFLFSIVAVCIAGSRNQEIAISTEYLRAHINESALNAKPVKDVGATKAVLPAKDATTTKTSAKPSDGLSTSSTTTTTDASKEQDDSSSEHDHDKSKSHDHEHGNHHDHDAHITVDLHNILDLFKQQFHDTEERILAAISEHDHSPTSTSTLLPALAINRK